MDNLSGTRSSHRRKYCFRIRDIYIKKNNGLIANTEYFDVSSEYGFIKCRRLNQISSFEVEKIGIDGKFELLFVPYLDDVYQ